MKGSISSLILVAGVFLSSCQREESSIVPKELRLDYYTESFEIPGLGFESQLKVQYEYDGLGKLVKYTVYGYNPTTDKLEVQRYFAFTYVGSSVNKIEGFLPDAGSPYIKYDYQYLADSRVSKIIESNYAAGINSEANFTYNSSNDAVRVEYTYSNGGAFEYEFVYSGENIQSDKTTRGSQLCSNGSYNYDQHVNPFKNLGYVDYLMTNLSVNNKLTENVNYIGCAFPTLVPQAYAYEYNDRGYPTVARTFYKSSTTAPLSVKKFVYKISS